MLSSRRTKIVATLGPSLHSKQELKKAIAKGMNVARLNFSHGDAATHLETVKHLRELSQELKAPVAILQDLQGPKIRVGRFKEDSITVNRGDEVIIDTAADLGEGSTIATDFTLLPKVCKEGTQILLDDGLLEFKVQKVKNTQVYCKVINGGLLKNNKGMNIPGVNLPVDCLTPKDLIDLEVGLEAKVDYIALSFVRSGEDIVELRELVNAKSPQTQIVAKIEMREAIENLKEIVELSDVVMVARGDLAVEVGQALLPGIQKQIITLCRSLGTPVITATQMLDSMVENTRPTRAEVTDVANAVMDGSDALMLSAETASGKFPFKCIRTMHEIILEVEQGEYVFYYDISLEDEFLSTQETIAAGACLSALKLHAETIVCMTTTGGTASLISSFRPRARIIAMTNSNETLAKLELRWGLQTFPLGSYKDTEEAMKLVEKTLLEYGLVKKGDKVILTLGVPIARGAKTNTIRVMTIRDEETQALDDLKKPMRCRDLPSAKD